MAEKYSLDYIANDNKIVNKLRIKEKYEAYI